MEAAEVGEKITCNIKTLSYLCIATDFLNSKALHRVDIGDNLFWLFENCCKFPVLSGEGLFVFIMAEKIFFKRKDLEFAEIPKDIRFKDISGERFGRLLVLGLAGQRGVMYSWYCACDCENVIEVRFSNLRGGGTRSCGCLSLEVKTKHGNARRCGWTGAYSTWKSMRGRCLNITNPGYHNYGGRGIRICDSWLNSFKSFLEDMGERPDGLCIERIDNNGDYCPQNCRWANRKDQANNTRFNYLLEYNGLTMNMTQWAGNTGIKRHVIEGRIRLGWSIERTLTTPTANNVKKLQSNA